MPVSAEAAGRPTLHYGAKGKSVKVVQTRLRALHYDPGAVDGRYGQDLRYAVWAFQKVNGLKPTGTIGTRTWRALGRPKAPVKLKSSPADRVEISKKRQLVVVYKGGRVRLITHTSTGSGRRYCHKGSCSVAKTPSGDFKVYRKINGWRHAPLGNLYKPIYFNGGIAMHGLSSVPLTPASHGCARIPMPHTANLLFKLVPLGMRVYVR
ncbi:MULTISPECIES: L,D-transpeptidase family protein [Actinomadura]|uniref:L,D-transpeptidase family protein n=1 Tax=Actinomadura yumaensis TaxID=111807 RepID=A0ABW2CHX1_9ACTN|nr:L,D-transpeptidase family protein [Actinomadura sp. J1-007]